MSKINPDIDAISFRRALGMFATGVLIVTTRWNGQVRGMTANSFSSVSLDPPLVLICIDNRAAIRQMLLESGEFGLSVLSHDQRHLSQHFSRSGSELEVEFEELEDVPIISNSLANFSCRVEQSHVAGDHLIFVGRVTAFNQAHGHPLLYFGGAYNQLHHPEAGGGNP
ncbi:hypothetical protein N185_32370 [Sinorhizobium sp. GW3]|nr:hypothetical protein N185_32370 [Sinorhizobium sp. GW3]